MRVHRFIWAAGALLAAGAGHAQTLSFYYTGGIVEFSAPNSGVYDITAVGAAGGDGEIRAAGLGASVEADVSLTAGQTLDILVGQTGATGKTGGGGGGGGGATYVVIHAGSPLLVGGGGGGGGFSGSTGQNAHDLVLLTSGPGSGGSASFDPDNGTGSGGGGLVSNGANGADPLFSQPTGGTSFQNGGAGGDGSTQFSIGPIGGNGGFGGGGGGSDVGAGGGGGYNGGNGGDSSTQDGGYAGASYYNSSLDTFVNYAASSVTTGSVTITSSALPEPSAAGMGAFLLAALWFRRSRRRPGLFAV